jgi:hypothetical protein
MCRPFRVGEIVRAPCPRGSGTSDDFADPAGFWLDSNEMRSQARRRSVRCGVMRERGKIGVGQSGDRSAHDGVAAGALAVANGL